MSKQRGRFLWSLPLLMVIGPLSVYWLNHPPSTEGEIALSGFVKKADGIEIRCVDVTDNPEVIAARFSKNEVKEIMTVLRLSNQQHFRPATRGKWQFDLMQQGQKLGAIHYLPAHADSAAMVWGTDAI